MSVRSLSASMLIVLLLVGCVAQPAPQAAPAIATAALPTSSPPTPAPPTPVPPPPAPPSATPHPFATLTEWDVVIITDSSLWGVAEPYARLLEQDRGIKVNLQDNWQGGLSAATILKALQGDFGHSAKREKWSQLIRDAEVLVLYGNPGESMGSDAATALVWNCVDRADPGNVPLPANAFEQYKKDLTAIYDEIAKLRAGRPLILRAVGAYNPVISVWREKGYAGVCVPFWEAHNDTIRQAAEAQAIMFVDTYAAFNGPDHSEDPRAKGYIKSDGEHPSEAGAQFYAELLLKSGYDTWVAPAD